jgi:hypothetical protein
MGVLDQIDIIEIARENERKQTQRAVSASAATTNSMIVRTLTSSKTRTKTILDTGCDWSVVGQGWHVIYDYDEVFHCQGAFFTDQSEVTCRLVDVMTIFAFDGMNRPPCLVRANRVLYCDDPAQLETLLVPIQLMAPGHAVDLTPIMFRNVAGERGKQGMQIAGQFLPFLFDGQQLFIAHRLPTTGELASGSAMELMSKCPSVYPVSNLPVPNNMAT